MKTAATRYVQVVLDFQRLSRVGVAAFAFVSSFILHPSSFAQTTQPTLDVRLGFADVFRPDAWSPLYVKLADPVSKAGTIEVRTTRGRIANTVIARVQSNPVETTFTLYAPLNPLDEVNVQWRDAKGKLIAAKNLTEQARGNPAALGGPVFGVAGPIASSQRVATKLILDTGEFIAAGAIPAALLPERSVGYEAIDVLILPELDTDAIDDDVESAIVDWIRAGGIVVTWAGALPPPEGSPLAAILPAEVGEVVVRQINGREVSTRALRKANGLVIEEPDETGSIFRRNVGLGHIALIGFDPSRGTLSMDDRLRILRKATASQVVLSPNERRTGSFDPLVPQARGEEQLEPAHAPANGWLWLGLAFGLVLGPGEALVLLLCRRPIITPLTMLGTAAALGTGLAIVLKPDVSDVRTIELVIETNEGVVAQTSISTAAPLQGPASWLIGQSADPLHQTAGEMTLLQRQDYLEAGGPIVSLSEQLPRVKSITFASSPARLMSKDLSGSSPAIQGSEGWVAGTAAFITRDQVRLLAKSPVAGEAMDVKANAKQTIDADDPATVRRETGIEALAAQPGWEALLMDRTIAQRLVTLFESENVAAIVAKSEQDGTTRFTVHLER